jgi:hypothetical protein
MSTAKRLIYVKATTVYAVPPVCHAAWTPEDWARVASVRVEPLVIDFGGDPWVATGERNERGQLLYEQGRQLQGRAVQP